MTDLSEYVSVGFTTEPAISAARTSPRHDIELKFERAGKAKPTNTQALLRLKSPFRRPEWLQDLQDNRPSWKHRTQHVARLYNVSLVVNPPKPDRTIKEITHG